MDAENKAEVAVARQGPKIDTKITEQDVPPLADGTNRKVNAPVTDSVAVTVTAANGSSVVFPQQIGNFQETLPNNDVYAYYTPGYNPYVSGPYVGYDGQSYYAPSYGPEACYSWDPMYATNLAMVSGSTSENLMLGPYAPENPDSSTPVKTNANGAVKVPLNSHAQAFEPQNKGKHAAGQLIFGNQNQSHSPYSGFMNGNENSSSWVHRHRYRKPGRNEVSDAAVELTVGPRTYIKNPPSESSVKKDSLVGLTIRRDMFNLPDFQTEYEDAKFYVIKSYSEDDIHKSIKYSVWSSTPNGNKKLDAAFRDAEEKSCEDNKKRPIFLFFSVNASRQFVGLAEMVGYVDFNKNLDFWQVDKWSGFFPVQWHIIKDIPNSELRHIILDNNDNKPVTHTRDTQEVKLKEGLQMLDIFKKYSAEMSLLDDMDFYEEREKALKAKKANKPATLRMDLYKNIDYDYESGEDSRRMNEGREVNLGSESSDTTPSSLINLTENLSLTGCSSSKNNGMKNEGETA
ncbi:PREDICTED: YTH domain-containing family protein 2-like isoform X2 [Tarenaya hassleriana]|uniref:YTH domain-containing family protein 2-like isoform X2 n=1 Tax=Tarenaya hassleriana TaxID=28532 RepID=UPI00053C6024|nr:PREDICTED: YTH domain-containing family protein 2-like isoform X2 [Tarenaya hassleriana]XP_010544089.1 PREDICTED: YTH domain-containing family protein 2-like isoform X2 [Tarenaya hassleriana]